METQTLAGYLHHVRPTRVMPQEVLALVETTANALVSDQSNETKAVRLLAWLLVHQRLGSESPLVRLDE